MDKIFELKVTLIFLYVEPTLVFECIVKVLPDVCGKIFWSKAGTRMIPAFVCI